MKVEVQISDAVVFLKPLYTFQFSPLLTLSFVAICLFILSYRQRPLTVQLKMEYSIIPLVHLSLELQPLLQLASSDVNLTCGVIKVFDQKLQFLGPPWVRTLVEVRTARRYSHDHSITSEVLSLVCPSLRV